MMFLEAIIKVVSSISSIITDILNLDFANFGSHLKDIWTNWDFAKSYNNDFKTKFYATGASDINSGTVFVAGEMGKTEAVYSGSNGKTNVANVKQMEQAFYNALSRYGQQDGGKIVVQAYIDNELVYEGVTSKAKSKGNVWAKA